VYRLDTGFTLCATHVSVALVEGPLWSTAAAPSRSSSMVALDGSRGRTFVTVFAIGQTERALLSTVSVEDYVHNAPHLVELNRVQGVGHLDMGIAFPLYHDG